MRPVKIPIVYYHSVGLKNPNWSRNHLTLKINYFERQIKYFAKHFTSITLKKYWESVNGFGDTPNNAICITFDDGYLDNWVWAFPLLKKYNVKATIFVSPEFINPTNKIRPIVDIEKPLIDKIQSHESSGFLTWQELKKMESSGLIDVQSHSMSHTKYFISNKLVGFNQPGKDVVYPIGNIYQKEKPFYIDNEQFNELIPHGYPFFEQASSVVAKRIWINDDFNNEVIDNLNKKEWMDLNFEEIFSIIKPIYSRYKNEGTLILKQESEFEYKSRVVYEIVNSKQVIEEKLSKKVEFMCWPHGDNNEFAHKTAIKAGYKATTIGNYKGNYNCKDRIDSRIGTNPLWRSTIFTLNRILFNINVYKKQFPYYLIKKAYHRFKY